MVCAALGHGNQGPEVHMVTSALAAHIPPCGGGGCQLTHNLELPGSWLTLARASDWSLSSL